MMLPKVSIIMPVYNAETYLQRAIDSVIAQTLQDWELLLVDDGSTDASPQICDDYAAKDVRIKVIHQQNRGVAMARQAGVKQAKGEYSIHADADDWMESTMLSDLYEHACATGADIVFSDFYTNNNGVDTYCQQNLPSLDAKSILYDMLNGKLFGSLWNKLLKHRLYENCHLSFFKGINFCEDLLIWCQLLQKQNLKISYINHAYYHYYKNPKSITHAFTRESYQMRKLFYRKLERLMDKRYDQDLLDRVAFSIYVEGFIYNVLTNAEIRDGIRQYNSQIFNLKSLRYKIGFLFSYLHLYKLARCFIHY